MCLHWHLRLIFMRNKRAMPQSTEPTHSQVGRGDPNVSLWDCIFFIKKQWCTFLLVLLVTGKLPSFLGYESKLSLVFWDEEKRKTIVILFKNIKGGVLTQISRPPERSSRWGQRAPTLFLSRWAGRRIPGLHRRAASPGAAGWYNPWECRHLPQIHSVKSESARKEASIISKWKSYKRSKTNTHTHTELGRADACSLALFFYC